MFFAAFLTVRNLYRSANLVKIIEPYGNEIIVFSVLLLLLALLAAINMLKFNSRGLIMTGIFVVFYAAYYQYLSLLCVKSDNSSVKYQTVGRYGLYIVDDYLITQCMLISVLALCVILFFPFIIISDAFYLRREGFICRHVSTVESQ